jgi:hypothetical protein
MARPAGRASVARTTATAATAPRTAGPNRREVRPETQAVVVEAGPWVLIDLAHRHEIVENLSEFALCVVKISRIVH